MSHLLQVSFRRLTPSEGLVALAATRYKQMRCALSGPGECVVVIEARDHERPCVTSALVTIEGHGRARVEANANHSDPHVALRIALEDVQRQLGIPLFAPAPSRLPSWQDRCWA